MSLMIHVSVEQLTKILAKVGISSSQEEEILTAAKSLTPPPEVKEESCISNEEQLFKQEIEEDKEKVSGELNQDKNHVHESLIERWFQASMRLAHFYFCFYFVKLHFLRHLIVYILLYSRFQSTKLNVNKFLLLLCRWLHWKFHFM